MTNESDGGTRIMALLCSHFHLEPEEVEAWDDEKFFTMYGYLKYYLEVVNQVQFKMR